MSDSLKAMSLGLLILLLISFPTISTEWARMTAELVEEEDDPHYGLPDIWDGKQVVCIHFPQTEAPDGYEQGRKHIDFDGSEFMSDGEWNESGVCIGGFSGHDSAWSLMNTAVTSTNDAFALNTTQYTFGIMVNSIAGVDPSQMSGNFSGAYWSLYHNGALSMVGVTELELDSDSVITWRVDTW